MSDNSPDSYKKLRQFLIEQISIKESEEEIMNIALIIMKFLFNLDQVEISLDRSMNMSPKQFKELVQIVDRINENEPVQYIIGQAEFYGRQFFVDPSVLIPRTETEELVHQIVHDHKNKKIKLLDIGTGSACIPITLAKELKGVRAFGIDFDPRVIKTARKNAEKHNVPIEFLLIDILNEPIPVQSLDIIVSNPPYVMNCEKSKMKSNVLDYEPETALYVSDDDPLLFYRRIGELARTSLKENGMLYFEINEKFGADIKVMLEAMDYHWVEVIKDINDKDRIIRARLSLDVFS